MRERIEPREKKGEILLFGVQRREKVIEKSVLKREQEEEEQRSKDLNDDVFLIWMI